MAAIRKVFKTHILFSSTGSTQGAGDGSTRKGGPVGGCCSLGTPTSCL